MANSAKPAARASLGFALGRALDSVGAYPSAFDAYAAANQASREAAGDVRYDHGAHTRLIDALIANKDVAPVHAAPLSRAPPIFICGMFRSGSTLVEQVMAAHRRVTAGGELPFLPALARDPALNGMERAKAVALAEGYLSQVRALFPSADVVTDKRPDNYLSIGVIKRLFPDAKIVHTIRQPLDNCLSIYFLHLDASMRYAFDLDDIGHHYLDYRRLMAHWRALYGADIYDFDYDAFVQAPRENVERLLQFCGLEWDENCLSFHTVRNAVKTASVWQVREPLYQRSSGRWRRYAPQLAGLREMLRDLL